MEYNRIEKLSIITRKKLAKNKQIDMPISQYHTQQLTDDYNTI